MKNIVIESMACPKSAVLTVSREELKEVCDKAWETNGRALIKKYDTKFEKTSGGDQPKAREFLEKNIGISKLYPQEISNFAVDQAQKSSGKKILFLHSTPRVTESENSEDANIYFVFYFTPEVKYDGPLDFTLPYVPEFTLETMVSNTLKAIKSKEFTGCLNDNCRFTLTLEANGKSDKSEYKSLSEIDYPSFKHILSTHKTKDEFSYSLPMGGEDKEFKVTISGVFYRDDAEVDDDIVKTYGYASLEDLKVKSEENYNRIQQNRKDNMAVDHVINEIVTKGVVDPIPAEFIQHHVRSLKEENYNTHGKKTTWDHYQVRSEAELEDKLDRLIVQDLLQSMAFRCYATLSNLETTDIEEIAKHIMTRIIWA